jgi:hypothetical protein
VRGVTLAEVADELYGLPPAEFTAARDEQARAAKAAGRPDDAAAIRKLARPTTSAWLVNRLIRDDPARLGRLFEVAEALQEAQRTLAGDRLRELSAQRREVVGELVPVAAAVARQAGQPASPAVLEEVRATLEAALADPGARDAIRTGRLTRALTYAGLGEVDLSAAAALAAATAPQRQAARPGRRPRAGHGAAEPGAEQAGPAAADLAGGDPAVRAAAAVALAESAAASASEAVTAAERELTSIAEQRQFLRRRISHLEGELAQARQEDSRLAADAQRTEQARAGAAREVRAAARQLERARREQAAPAGPGD